MATKATAQQRVAIVALLVLSLGLVTISCDPGTELRIVNERDAALIVHAAPSPAFTIPAGNTYELTVLLNSSSGTLVITGQDTGDTLFNQSLTWEQMTEMEFRLIID